MRQQRAPDFAIDTQIAQRLCERSEAILFRDKKEWIASSQELLAMTLWITPPGAA
jgi:hypothetical protein